MDFAIARKNMVESQVRTNDVTDQRIQRLMGQIPRESFLPPELRPLAYAERELEYAPGRKLWRAREFSKLIHAAEIDADDLVLDVGCGLGYSAAVLAGLASVVVALESDEAIAATAQENLAALEIDNAAVVMNPLPEGYPKQGPYDVIVINGAIEREPEALLAQLKDGGRLVCVFSSGPAGKAVLITRSGDAFGRRALFDANITARAPGFEARKTFVF